MSKTTTKSFIQSLWCTHQWQRKTRENVSSLQNETEDLVTQDSEKAKVLNPFFASALQARTALWNCRSQKPGEEWSKENAAMVRAWSQGILSRLSYKSIGSDKVPFWMLRELIVVTVRALAVIFLWSWQLEEVLEDWRNVNVSFLKMCKEQNLRNNRLVSLTSVPGNVMGQLILENIF